MSMENEIFKQIDNLDYKISNYGRVIRISDGYELKNSLCQIDKTDKRYYCCRLVINGKPHKRLIHTLMMLVFRKDERIPFFQRNYSGIAGKSGRPSKEDVINSNKKVVYTKKVGFIDGDTLNIKLENLKWLQDGILNNHYCYKTENKYANVFYTGEYLIKIIERNSNSNFSKKINGVIIKFLKGDDSAIWVLFEKYKKYYLKFLWKWFKKNSFIKKETALEMEDFLIEAQIKIIDKIKNGRYDGRSFLKWTTKVLEKNLVEHFVSKNKQKTISSTDFIIRQSSKKEKIDY